MFSGFSNKEHALLALQNLGLSQTEATARWDRHNGDMRQILAELDTAGATASEAFAPIPFSSYNPIQLTSTSDEKIAEETSDRATQLMNWLEDEYKDDGYRQTFVENEFDRWENITCLGKDDLRDDLGIDRAAHRIRILKKIQSMDFEAKIEMEEDTDLSFVAPKQADDDREAESVLFVFGETGAGKSTVCNRLAGNASQNLSRASFKVSPGAKGCTDQIAQGDMIFHDESVVKLVDSPGLNDPQGRDQQFIRSIIRFFLSCLIPKKLFVLVKSVENPRLTESEQAHFEFAHALFGDGLWDNMTIVFTRVDISVDVHHGKQLEKFENKIKSDGGVEHYLWKKFRRRNVDMITIGDGNFGESVRHIYEQSLQIGEFQSELILKLRQLQATASVLDKWKLGEDLKDSFDALVRAAESKSGRPLRLKSAVTTAIEAEKSECPWPLNLCAVL